MYAATLLLAVAGAAHAQEPPVYGFSFGPSETIEHDSNVLRVPTVNGLQPVQSDTIYSTDLVGSFHQVYGREDINASATVGRVNYTHLKQFDYTQQDLRAALQSQLPLDVNAGVTVDRSVQLAHFADLNTVARDVLTRNEVDATLDVPLLDREWRGVATVSGLQSRNSDVNFQTQDYNQENGSAGIRYAPTTGNHIDLLARGTHGSFPNATPASLLSKSFTERGADISVDWTFLGKSWARGHAGFVRRTSEPVPFPFSPSGTLSRDFSGPTVDLTYAWQATASSHIAFYVARETGATGDNAYLASVGRTLRIAPSFQPTAKLQLGAYAEWIRRDYFDNVYDAYFGPSVARVDHSRNGGITATWNPYRWLQASLDLHHEMRDSNIQIWSFANNVAMLGLQATFR